MPPTNDRMARVKATDVASDEKHVVYWNHGADIDDNHLHCAENLIKLTWGHVTHLVGRTSDKDGAIYWVFAQ